MMRVVRVAGEYHCDVAAPVLAELQALGLSAKVLGEKAVHSKA